MVTSNILLRNPSVDVHVLEIAPANPPRRPRASVHVVQLLLARAEGVSIPLVLRHLPDDIQVLKPGDLNKAAQGLNDGELVEVARGNDGGVLVLRQDLRDERACQLGLLRAAVDAAVDGRARVALERRRAALAGPVVVDGEKGAAAVDELPVGGERLARVAESRPVVDAAGVEAQSGAGDDFVDVRCGAGVGVAQAHLERVVEVGGLDVAAGDAAVLVVDGVNTDGEVVDAGNVADGLRQGGEGQVGVGHAVVGFAGVVLDFLQEHDGGRVEVVDDVLGDQRHAGVVRGEVLDVVGTEGQSVAAAVG